MEPYVTRRVLLTVGTRDRTIVLSMVEETAHPVLQATMEQVVYRNVMKTVPMKTVIKQMDNAFVNLDIIGTTAQLVSNK